MHSGKLLELRGKSISILIVKAYECMIQREIGAISTAKWSGARLRDVLLSMGLDDAYIENNNIRHVQFVSADGLEASIPIRKALDKYGDVLLAYEMNDGEIPAVHGYPLRLVVPGHVGVRNVKWVSKIILSAEEAQGPWQRGMGKFTAFVNMIIFERFNSLQRIQSFG